MPWANDPRQVGGVYYNHYWRLTYVVLERTDMGVYARYRVQWEDGRVTEHCTSWDSRDKIVSDPAEEVVSTTTN